MFEVFALLKQVQVLYVGNDVVLLFVRKALESVGLFLFDLLSRFVIKSVLSHLQVGKGSVGSY